MPDLYRTMLFIPGNDPAKLRDAGIYGSDCVIFDLEDAVAVTEKDAARILVRNALLEFDYPCKVGVRINHISTIFGFDDLVMVLEGQPDFIRLPKTETAQDICEIDKIITEAEKKYGFPINSIKIMASIETAKGVLNAPAIAAASPRMLAIALGPEDFTVDMQAVRSRSGEEIYVAKSLILLAARAAGIHATDTIFADFKDEEGLLADTTKGKQLGFDGKSVIHPCQIPIVHKAYQPTAVEIENSVMIVAAARQALENNLGVTAVNGKMIDGPIIVRAQRILDYAKAYGLEEGLNNEKCSQ